MDVDNGDGGGSPPTVQMVDFSTINRKRIPKNSLVAIENEIVVGIGLPSKSKKGEGSKIMAYSVSPQGALTLDSKKAITEDEFTTKYIKILRTTSPVTVGHNGGVTVQRLSSNVSIVKDTKKRKQVPEEEEGDETEVQPSTIRREEGDEPLAAEEETEMEDVTEDKSGLDLERIEKEPSTIEETVEDTEKEISERKKRSLQR